MPRYVSEDALSFPRFEGIFTLMRLPHVSFDIDFVDPSSAPGTGTPEIGRPSAREVLALLHNLAGISVVGADLVEVLPSSIRP
ncbi:MAG: arginase family protein, partial [Chloroflexota bacterium]